MLIFFFFLFAFSVPSAPSAEPIKDKNFSLEMLYAAVYFLSDHFARPAIVHRPNNVVVYTHKHTHQEYNAEIRVLMKIWFVNSKIPRLNVSMY